MSSADMLLHTFFHWSRQSILFICLVACASSYAGDWALSDLMHLLAQKKSGKASFVEKKYIGFLDKPLESSGELSFDSPDRLEKRTLKPRQESMMLDGDKLIVTMHEKRPLNLRLQDHPEISTLIESIRGTLSGDKVALERNYTIDLSGVQAKWQLTLLPVHKDVTKVVRKIQISGVDADLKTITFDQADGDRFEMTIFKVVSQ
jgi:hypothetical protein